MSSPKPASRREPIGEAQQAVQELALLELLRRHVDRDAHRAAARLAPALEVLDRFEQRPVAERHDHAGGLENRKEAAGQHQAIGGIAPAQQRLGGVDRPVARSICGW